MVTTNKMMDKEYTLLEYKKDEKIPYLKGTRIRIDIIYCYDYKVERKTPEYIAKNRDLPLQDIRQAIEWCTLNDDLVTKVLTQENNN